MHRAPMTPMKDFCFQNDVGIRLALGAKRSMADRIISIIVVILGMMVIWLTLGLPPPAMKGTPGPAYLPRMVGFGLILCGLILFLKSGRPSKETDPGPLLHLDRRVLSIMILAALMPVSLGYLGFILTCFGSSFVFLKILRTSLFMAIVVAVLITGVIYFSFHYGLQVQFPQGILG